MRPGNEEVDLNRNKNIIALVALSIFSARAVLYPTILSLNTKLIESSICNCAKIPLKVDTGILRL